MRRVVWAAAVLVVVAGLLVLVALRGGPVSDAPAAGTDAPRAVTTETARPGRVPAEAAEAAPATTAEDGARLDVRVVDLGGAAVPGATLAATAVRPRDEDGRGAPETAPVRAACDAAGHASLGPLATGRWRVRAEAKGRAPADADVVVRPGAAPPPLTIVLQTACALDGFVRDPEGRGVAGATVAGYAEYREDRPWARATSGADGAYHLAPLPPGVVHLAAARDGDATGRVAAVVVPDVRRVDLVLEAPIVVTGTARVLPDGRPLAGADVVVSYAYGCRRPLRARTDADGRYRFEGAPSGSIMVRLAGDDVLPQSAIDRLHWTNVAPGGTYVFDLDAWSVAGGVTGRVLGDDGSGVAGARVTLLGMTPWKSVVRRETTSGPDGAYSALGLPPGTYVASARTDTLVPRGGLAGPVSNTLYAIRSALDAARTAGSAVRVADAVVAGHDLRVTVGGTVSGTVVVAHVGADARPVADAEVRASGLPDAAPEALARTDAAGAFVLRGLDAGDALVVAASHPRAGEGRSEPFALTLGAARDGVRIVLAPHATVRGRLVSADGAPLADALVRLSPVDPHATVGDSEWRVLPPVAVGADGAFEAPVPGASGWVRVRGEARGRSRIAVGPLAAKPGSVVDAGTIVLPPEVRLRGRVVAAADRAPVAGARVDVWPGASDAASAVSGPDGAFEAHVPAPDPDDADRGWQLQVAAPGFVWRHADVTDPSLEVVVALERSAALAGRVVDAAGRPVAGMTVCARRASGEGFERETATSDDGAFAFGSAAAGAWTLRGEAVVHDGDVVAVDATPVEAPTTDCVLRARRSSRIAGRVEDADGAAVPGIWVEIARGNTRHGAATGPTGAFDVAGLDPGTLWDVSVGRWGTDFVPTVLTGIAAGTADLRVVVRHGETLDVRFVDGEGRPVAVPPHLRLSVTDPSDREFSASCETSGPTARIPGLRPGRMTLWLESLGMSGWPYLDGRQTVTVPSDGPVVVVLVRGAQVAGDVVTEEGRPLGDVWVAGYPAGARLRPDVWPAGASETATDEAGHFRLEKLAPGTRYVVVARGDEDSGRGLAVVADVGDGTTDLRLVLRRGRTVKGRLLGADGAAVAEAFLLVLDDRGLPRSWATTDDDGSFVLAGLPDGAADVVLRAADAAAPDVPVGTVPPGATEVTLRVPAR